MIDQISLQNNTLQIGSIFNLKLNTLYFQILNSLIQDNNGQFAFLDPIASSIYHPLKFFIDSSTFLHNNAKVDALIQLTTNSEAYITNSLFLENFSSGRGSIVFADYQGVYSKFDNCNFTRNYAYQGGVFYIQYQSSIEISNCYLVENFAVIGGVAYVNNDGLIKIN